MAVFANMIVPFASLILCTFSVSWATVTISFDEEFKRCDNGKEMISLDFSELDVLMLDNENITLDGKLRFVNDFNNPTSVTIKLERNLNGVWLPGISRFVPNFCTVIGNPKEMWSPVIGAFSQRSCPYQSGHIETFDRVNVGNMAHSSKLPPSLMGDWRMYFETSTVRDGKVEAECTMANFVLEDA